MPNSAVTTVAICIATLHRPVGLRALLESLVVLQVPSGVDLRIVVVDNDGTASASDLVAGYRERVPGRLDYVVEDRAGIPFARNRAVSAAGARILRGDAFKQPQVAAWPKTTGVRDGSIDGFGFVRRVELSSASETTRF